jgi:hypothetical protein
VFSGLWFAHQSANAATGDITVTPNQGLMAGNNTVNFGIENAVRHSTIAEYSAAGSIVQALRGSASDYLTGGGFGGSDTIALRGTSSFPSSSCSTGRSMPYYQITADLTNFNTLEYYVKQGALHGLTMVAIDDFYDCGSTVYNFVHYNTLSATDWTLKSVDISGFSGAHTIYFIGGYTDSTGYLTSETLYSAIRLADYPTAVAMGGNTCTGITPMRDYSASSTVSCLAPPSRTAGSVDVTLTTSQGSSDAADAYTYIGYSKYLLSDGDLTVTITGDFAGLSASDVQFVIDGQACSNLSVVNITTATCQAPARGDGMVTADLTIGSQTFNGLAIWYYSYTPKSGPSAGGTTLTVSGVSSGLAAPLSLTDGTLTQGGKYDAPSTIQATGGFSGGAMIDLIGSSNVPPGSTAWMDSPHYTISLDLTYVQTLQFYARKVVNHGNIIVAVDNTRVLSHAYAGLSTDWNLYTVDLSSYSGIHDLVLMGGYLDSTGNALSQTRFSDIYLAYSAYAVDVKLDGVACTSPTLENNGDTTCQTSSHVGGLVDVEFGFGGDSVTVADGFEYITTLALTLNKIKLSLGGPPNRLLADYLTANVITDNPIGYHLDITASEPRLKCTTSNHYINPLSTAGAMADNQWGYAVGSSGVTPPTAWTGVTTTDTPLKTATAATDLALGDDTTIWLGTRANYTLPACQYSGTITLTAIPNKS